MKVEPQTASNKKLSIVLNALKERKMAVIERLELDQESNTQLLRLGLVPGRCIEVLKSGSRCLISVAGSRLALDATLASLIYVTVEA